jgi:septal ring factor EnvC (AmiA/AmiB activator)
MGFYLGCVANPYRVIVSAGMDQLKQQQAQIHQAMQEEESNQRRIQTQLQALQEELNHSQNQLSAYHASEKEIAQAIAHAEMEYTKVGSILFLAHFQG